MSDPRGQHLPPVWKLLEHPRIAPHKAIVGHAATVDAIRRRLEHERNASRDGTAAPFDTDQLAQRIALDLAADRPALVPVINATGVLLHTGLGRAPLSSRAIEHVVSVLDGYCSLEIDLATGERGRRHAAVAHLLRQITGAEAAIVVNNNAAATLLALRVVGRGREIIVSRGQLIEIGGEFRLPEIFEVSGALLREVGTTNKTRIEDYARAIGPTTAAFLRVHPSNFRIDGFAESVAIEPLCTLAREHGLVCIDDIGSGALRPDHAASFPGEPTIHESLAAGSDLILCSGDKLLGGPQCGIILGRREWVERIAKDPMMRAMRLDKLVLAALEGTLREIRSASTTRLWQLIATPADQLRDRARSIAARFAATPAWSVSAQPTQAFLGGGSCPQTSLDSWAIKFTPGSSDESMPINEIARCLRLGNPAVMPRVQENALWIDLRCVLPEQDDSLITALEIALSRCDHDPSSAPGDSSS